MARQKRNHSDLSFVGKNCVHPTTIVPSGQHLQEICPDTSIWGVVGSGPKKTPDRENVLPNLHAGDTTNAQRGRRRFLEHERGLPHLGVGEAESAEGLDDGLGDHRNTLIQGGPDPGMGGGHAWGMRDRGEYERELRLDGLGSVTRNSSALSVVHHHDDCDDDDDDDMGLSKRAGRTADKRSLSVYDADDDLAGLSQRAGRTGGRRTHSEDSAHAQTSLLSATRQQLIVWLLWNACIRDQKNPVAFFQWCQRLYREGILDSVTFLNDLGALQRSLEDSFLNLFGSEAHATMNPRMNSSLIGTGGWLAENSVGGTADAMQVLDPVCKNQRYDREFEELGVVRGLLCLWVC